MNRTRSEHSRSSTRHAAIRSSGVRPSPAAAESSQPCQRVSSPIDADGVSAMLPSISARDGSARSAVRNVRLKMKPWYGSSSFAYARMPKALDDSLQGVAQLEAEGAAAPFAAEGLKPIGSRHPRRLALSL